MHKHRGQATLAVMHKPEGMHKGARHDDPRWYLHDLGFWLLLLFAGGIVVFAVDFPSPTPTGSCELRCAKSAKLWMKIATPTKIKSRSPSTARQGEASFKQ
jgi:hypothetical protein